MKKFSLKNYIAFTLSEMTLVFLIMSIVAAATTPIVTKGVKNINSTYQGEASASLCQSVPGISKVGIYCNQDNINSMFSVGLKPWDYTTGNYNSNANLYGHPALAIQTVDTSAENSIQTQPQLAWFAGPGLHVIDSAPRIGMDMFKSILISSKSSFSGANGHIGSYAVVIGSANYVFFPLKYSLYRNTSIGSYLLNGSGNYYLQDSVIIGSKVLSGVNNVNFNRTVAIGDYTLYGASVNDIDTASMYHNNWNTKYANSTVAIGHYAGAKSIRMHNNIAIGSYASYKSRGSYNVRIGAYAGNFLYSNSVEIGSFAGAVNYPTSDDTNISGNQNNDRGRNISIGYYSGSAVGFTYSGTGLSQDVINIGIYAGSNPSYSQYAQNSIAIGPYANGYYKQTVHNTSGIVKSDDWSVPNKTIAIGFYANNQMFYSGTSGSQYSYRSCHIAIGPNACRSGSGDIAIGRYAFYNSRSVNNNADKGIDDLNLVDVRSSIAVGNEAGMNSQDAGTFIGYQAGSNYKLEQPHVDISTTDIVGIGSYAMAGYQTEEGLDKFLIGPSVKERSGTYNNYYYNSLGGIHLWATGKTGEEYAQMMLTPKFDPTNSNFKQDSNSIIILYSGLVFGPSQTMIAVSDKRLKENIRPSKHSINDLRKINVYDYSMKSDETHATRTGVIAQELKKVLPEAVSLDGMTNRYAINSDWIMYTMVNAIKDVDKFVCQLRQDLKVYINDFKALRTRVTVLENRARQLEKQNVQLRNHLNKINAKLQ